MIYILYACLATVVGMFSYHLGRYQSDMEHKNEKLRSMEQANQIRDTLSNPDTVDKLQQKYKR